MQRWRQQLPKFNPSTAINAAIVILELSWDHVMLPNLADFPEMKTPEKLNPQSISTYFNIMPVT
jgi:hypothetical protein